MLGATFEMKQYVNYNYSINVDYYRQPINNPIQSINNL